MINLDGYKTGNKGFDEKVAKALAKEPVKVNRLQLLQIEEEPRQSKYGVDTSDNGKAARTYYDGTLFASVAELERWDFLLKVERAGEIMDVRKQVPFIVFDGFSSDQWGEIKPIIYVSDFTYTNLTFRKQYPGRKCVEDSKTGILTTDYKLKKKLFLKRYGKDLLFFEV